MDAAQAVNLVRRIELMLAFAEVSAAAQGELASDPAGAAPPGCPDRRVADRQAAVGARVSGASIAGPGKRRRNQRCAGLGWRARACNRRSRWLFVGQSA